MNKISFLLMMVIIFVSGCAPEKFCDVKTVILEESFFPGTASSEPIDVPIPDAPPVSAEGYFYIKTDSSIDSVQQDIMKFRWPFQAKDFVENANKQVFRTNSMSDQWELPKELENLELSYDQSYIGCGIVLGGKTCRWIARYEEYYVYLRSDISGIGMTVNVFADAVREIDLRMSFCTSQ